LGGHTREPAVVVEPFRGSLSEFLPLFSHADDSPAEINSYIELGEVLVARSVQRIICHIQLIAVGADWEIKSVAVIEQQQGQGIGAALVRAALDRAFSAGGSRVLVATATADIDKLRFYQRLGFRMDRVERDAFSVDRGYPSLKVDDIPVRDKVWFSINVNDRRWSDGETSPYYSPAAGLLGIHLPNGKKPARLPVSRAATYLCWQAFRLSAVIAAQSGGTKPPDWLRQTSAQGSVGRTGGYRQTKNSRQLEQSSYCLNKRCYRTDNWRDQTGFLDFRAPTVVKREERVWERGVAPL